MKSTVLLTTALFLASAPSPDSDSITQLSGGFLSIPDARGLLAADATPAAQLADATPVALPVIELAASGEEPETPPADAEIKQRDTQQ